MAPGTTALLTLLLALEAVSLAVGGVSAALSLPLPVTSGAWGFPGFQAVAAVVFTGSALPIIRQRPRLPIGWLLVAVAVLSSTQFAGTHLALYGLVAAPGALPGAWIGLWFSAWTWIPTVGLLGMTALYFPTGSLPSRRWRPAAWATAVGIVSGGLGLAVGYWGFTDTSAQRPLVPPGAPALASVLVGVGLPLVVFGLGVGSVSVIARLRTARGIEHEQLKWLAFAGAGCALAFVIYVAFNAAGHPETIAATLPAIAFLGLPIAIGIAVMRHQLYDIDRIINRTLVYGAVTAVLAVIYAASVLALQSLLASLVHTTQPAVAASTLLVAGLFQPIRRRSQIAVDRRFYRARYDAERTAARFGERVRQETDIETVALDLRGTVEETVAPATAALWLRPKRHEGRPITRSVTVPGRWGGRTAP